MLENLTVFSGSGSGGLRLCRSGGLRLCRSGRLRLCRSGWLSGRRLIIHLADGISRRLGSYYVAALILNDGVRARDLTDGSLKLRVASHALSGGVLG